MRGARPTAALRCKQGGARGQSGAQHCGCGRRARPCGGRTCVATCLGSWGRENGGVLCPTPHAHWAVFGESAFRRVSGVCPAFQCAAKCRCSAEPSNAGIPPPKGPMCRHSMPLTAATTVAAATVKVAAAPAPGLLLSPDAPSVPRNALLMGPQFPGTDGTSGPRSTGPAIRRSTGKRHWTLGSEAGLSQSQSDLESN